MNNIDKSNKPEESERAARAFAAHRKANFACQTRPAEKGETEVRVTHNGYQWSSFFLNGEELLALRDVLSDKLALQGEEERARKAHRRRIMIEKAGERILVGEDWQKVTNEEFSPFMSVDDLDWNHMISEALSYAETKADAQEVAEALGFPEEAEQP